MSTKRLRFIIGSLTLLVASGFSTGERNRISVIEARSAAAGITVTILIDVTASMHRSTDGVAGIPSTAKPVSPIYFEPIPPAVEPFRLLGLQSGDRVRVGAIARVPRIGDRFMADESEWTRAWKALFELPPVDWLGPSPIWDAIGDAATGLANESGRRAIVIVTDGQASGNRIDSAAAAQLATRAGIPVHVVAEEVVWGMNPLRPLSAHGIDPARSLRALADLTGGTFVLDRAEPDLGQLGLAFKRNPEAALKSVLERLHR